MAAKSIDKEALKKNLFWILLGVFLVFWIAGVVVAIMPGNDQAAKDYAAAKTKVEGVKSVKTPAYQEPWHKHGQTFRDYKDVIWKKVWEQQAGMYTWPDSMLAVVPRPLYPEDPFVRNADGSKNVTEDQNARNRFPDWYREQFVNLDLIVAPARFNGGFEAVFPEQTWKTGSAPTQEEIWLAQEDFWVRREMLYLIRQAMDAVALFREVPQPKGDKPPEGAVAKRVFRNANWELTLLLERAPTGRGVVISERSTIKNINIDQRTQLLANAQGTQGLPFRFQQAGSAAYKDIRISGEPVPFEKEAPISKEKISVAPVELNDPNKQFFIEQLLDWEISPVRRVDMLAVARHSHRTITDGTKINPTLKALEPVEAPPEGEGAKTPSGGQTGGPTGGPTGGGAMPPNASMGMQIGGTGNMTGNKGGSPTGDVTSVTQIPRERYLHWTPQSRHLPVVMRLIVDQAHIHDILSSISNSRLRMQITQVSFHHARGITRDSGTEPAAKGTTTMVQGNPGTGMKIPTGPPSGMKMPAPNAPPSAGLMMPNMSGSMAGMMMTPGAGRFILGGPRDTMGGTPRTPGTAATPTARSVDNARLVELTVYAIAALYDRYPPRPKDTTTPADKK